MKENVRIVDKKYYLSADVRRKELKHISLYAIAWFSVFVVWEVLYNPLDWGRIGGLAIILALYVYLKYRILCKPWAVLKPDALYAHICHSDSQHNDIRLSKVNFLNPFIEIPYTEIRSENAASVKAENKIYRHKRDKHIAVYIPANLLGFEECVRLIDERIEPQPTQ